MGENENWKEREIRAIQKILAVRYERERAAMAVWCAARHAQEIARIRGNQAEARP